MENTVAISLGGWWTWCLPLWCLQAYPGWSFAARGAAVMRREFGPVDIACLDQPPGAVWGQLTGDMASKWQATDSQLALAAGGAGR